MVDVTGLMYEVNMNGIALSDYQKELLEWSLHHCEEHWAVDGDGIKEVWEYYEQGDVVPPTTWTLPKIMYGELILSDYRYVNDTLREWLISAKWLKRSCYNVCNNSQSNYQKRKWSKACKDLIYKIDGETMFKT